MKATDFLSILYNRQKLATVSYEQLDNLLLQHPYCYNLRLLLLKKYQTDEHRAFGRQLSLASAYAPDRQFLARFVTDEPTQDQGIITLTKEEKTPEKEPILADKTEERAPETKEQEEEVAKNIEQPKVDQKVSAQPPSLDLQEIIDLVRANEQADEEEREISLMPLEEWVKGFTPPRINDSSTKQGQQRKRFKLSRIPVFEDKKMLDLFDNKKKTTPKTEEKAPPKKKEMRKKKKSFDFFSESTEAFLQSLSQRKKQAKPSNQKHNPVEDDDDDEPISETLANLLALQGQKEKAIEMYQALSLKFPEKNRYFADKIEELEN